MGSYYRFCLRHMAIKQALRHGGVSGTFATVIVEYVERGMHQNQCPVMGNLIKADEQLCRPS